MENRSQAELIRALLAQYQALTRRFGSAAHAADAVQDTHLRLLEHRLPEMGQPAARCTIDRIGGDHVPRAIALPVEIVQRGPS